MTSYLYENISCTGLKILQYLVLNPVGPPFTYFPSHDDALLLEVRVELLVQVLGVGRRPAPRHSGHVRLGRQVLALVEEQVGGRLVDLLGRNILEYRETMRIDTTIF